MRPLIKELTKKDLKAALRTNHDRLYRMTKWHVEVDGRMISPRALVQLAIGEPPNGPTNTYRAVVELKKLGYRVWFKGKEA